VGFSVSFLHEINSAYLTLVVLFSVLEWINEATYTKDSRMPPTIAAVDVKATPAKPTNGKQPKANAKPTPTVAESKPVEIPVAAKNSFKFRESCSNRYLVRLPLSVTLDQAENKKFMQQCLMIKSGEFGGFDEIFAVAGDSSWSVEWLVTDAEAGRLNLAYQRTHEFEKTELVGERRVPQGFSIARDRVSRFYYAQRDSDGLRFVDGCYTHENALRELLDHGIFRK